MRFVIILIKLLFMYVYGSIGFWLAGEFIFQAQWPVAVILSKAKVITNVHKM